MKDILNLGFTAHLESKVKSCHILVILCDQILITIKFEEKSVDGVEDQNHGDQVSPELPMTQEEAMRFQEENLAAAVIID